MANKGSVLVAGHTDSFGIKMGEILRGGGYETLYTSDGKTGGELIEDNRESLSLVIVERGLTTEIDIQPIVRAACDYGIPFIYDAYFTNLILDLSAKIDKVLTIVGDKTKEAEKKE